MSTYNDKIVVFRTNSINAVKAINEIDSEGYVRINVHESVVSVTFLSVSFNRYANEDELLNKITNVLKKYNIEYKIKKMTF